MDKHFWRQFVVMLCIVLQSICDGISVTMPGVMNPFILSPNTTDVRATPAEASWIAAAAGFGCLPAVFITTFLVDNIGRKYTQAISIFIDMLSWVFLTFAYDTTTIFAARFIRGLGEPIAAVGIMISEYANPNRRGYFSTMRKLGLGLGCLISHSMSLYFSWRHVSMVAAVSLLISFLLTLTWKESPAYCAMKGRFKECETNFLWLHGDSKERREELEHLMAAQMLRLEKDKTQNKIKTVYKTFLDKGFLKALIISMLLTLIIDLCGRYYYFAYMKQIFIMITNSQSFADYCAVANDLLTLVGLIMSCFIIKYFNRRTLVFVFGSITAFLMLSISLCCFLNVKPDIGLQHQWVTPSLLILLSFVSNLGVIPINFAITSELFLLEHRGLGSFVNSLMVVVFYILSMKFTYEVLDIIGLYGTYGILFVGMLMCLSLLYFLLPETRDRTMQDIGDEINNEDKSVIKARVGILKEKLREQENEYENNLNLKV